MAAKISFQSNLEFTEYNILNSQVSVNVATSDVINGLLTLYLIWVTFFDTFLKRIHLILASYILDILSNLLVLQTF